MFAQHNYLIGQETVASQKDTRIAATGIGRCDCFPAGPPSWKNSGVRFIPVAGLSSSEPFGDVVRLWRDILLNSHICC